MLFLAVTAVTIMVSTTLATMPSFGHHLSMGCQMPGARLCTIPTITCTGTTTTAEAGFQFAALRTMSEWA